jgi:hypothetical protein
MRDRLLYITAAIGLTRRRSAQRNSTTFAQRVMRVVVVVVLAVVVVRVGFAALIRLGGVAWLAAALLGIVGAAVLLRRWRRT